MGLHGVQVVGGSNPPCPTNQNPLRVSNFRRGASCFGGERSGRVAEYVASSAARSDGTKRPPRPRRPPIDAADSPTEFHHSPSAVPERAGGGGETEV